MKARFFGQYLVSSGKISAAQLMAALEYQTRTNAKLGSQAVALGLATPFEVEQVLALQAKEDLQFGEAAIRLGVLDEAGFERVRAAQVDQHVQLGDALVALGTLTRAAVETAAAEFLAAEAALEPEVVTVPKDLPLHDVAFELFYLANKLLLRVCELESKTERVRITQGEQPLLDHNAKCTLTGVLHSCVFLCVPAPIALEIAGRFSGELAPGVHDAEHIVLALANLLCENLRSVLAERGTRIEIEPAERVTNRARASTAQVAWVPFLTHRGQVLVGLELG